MNHQFQAVGCFDADTLRDFGAGRLHDVALMERVAAHLDSCANCEANLATIDYGDDPLLAMVRSDLNVGSPKEASLPPTRLATTVHLAKSPVPTLDGAAERRRLPERIGKYKVMKELGRGGFGTVYLAKDPDQQRMVAVKVPHADRLPTEKIREAFLREARITAELEHPAIVKVYDWGEDDLGNCFVVMEYIEGQTLRCIMASGGLGPRRAVKLIRSLLPGLSLAHRRGIYHRDIKPENIFVVRGRCKLGDFGLAMREEERWQHLGECVGSRFYMSPEQWERRHVDERTDIWSVGIVLYELLSSRRPFQGSNEYELRDEVLHRELPPLRRENSSSVSARLEEIVTRCLQKKPEARYAIVDDLHVELRGAAQRFPRLIASARLLAALAAVGLVIAVGLMFVASPLVPASIPPETPPGWKLLRDRDKLVWPSVVETTRMSQGSPGETTLDTTDFVLVRCGTAEVPAFRYRTTFQRNAWSGHAGLFWGYQTEPRDPSVAHCQTLFVSSGNSHYLQRELLTIRSVGEEEFVDTRPLGNAIQLEVPGFDECQLEIRVVNNRLQSILWNGKEMKDLIDPAPIGTDPDVPSCTGGLGLLNYMGSSCFRTVEFKDLMEKHNE